MEQLVYVDFVVNGQVLIVRKVNLIFKFHFFVFNNIFLGKCSGNYKCLNGGLCNKNYTIQACVCPSTFEGLTCEKSRSNH